ncbi:hypothetical protein GYMLUDRAFT_241040 [Collybiopsis luxurians FD-317 M1]|nr:hypothetical protein GYMLUDRAFT_241040 [Collybiopsis luxurians FD-317 M1]
MPLISLTKTLYGFLIPSVLRAITLNLTADSLRSILFTDQSAPSMIANCLTPALSAPVSQEPMNYRRLETLSDMVLRLVMAAQLLGVSIWPGVFDEEEGPYKFDEGECCEEVV